MEGGKLPGGPQVIEIGIEHWSPLVAAPHEGSHCLLALVRPPYCEFVHFMSHSSTESEAKATSPRIEVYVSAFCPYCSFAKRLLKQQGLAFDRISVDFSRTRRADMEARSGRSSVPQVFIGQTHVGGYDDLSALVVSGGLPAVLAKEGLSLSSADPTLQL